MTNAASIIKLPCGLDEEQVKDKLEEWCSDFGAWLVSGNYISYGYKEIDIKLTPFQAKVFSFIWKYP